MINITPTSKNCVVGTCLLMCPPSEVCFRNENNLIHQLESSHNTNSSPNRLVGDPQKMVKEYIRSATGYNLLNPEILRPPAVLLTTVDYLLDLYKQLKSSKLAVVFSFVSDRLRAVRQDMILQQLSPVDTMDILQKMIPFYIETDYFCKLHECSAYNYKLHSTQIEECFLRWTEVVRLVPKDMVNPLIVCSYLMRRIFEPSSMLDVYRWKFYLSIDLWSIVHSIVLCARSYNYSGFFRNLHKLPRGFIRASTINAIISIRLRALEIIKVAYKSPPAKIPIDIMSKWLCYSPIDDLEKFLSHFDIPFSDYVLVSSLEAMKSYSRECEKYVSKCYLID